MSISDPADIESILANIKIGDIVNIILINNDLISGRFMPRYAYSDDNHIVIKLNSGYNIGIKKTRIRSITKTHKNNKIIPKHPTKIESVMEFTNNIHNQLPKIALLSTGGTIASKIDYRTGGVKSILSAAELYSSIPELSKYAVIDTDVLLNEYSENIGPKEWHLIADKVAEKVNMGIYSGIIISHGTDTMGYTAAALSFALQNLPIPVLLVGAQRSSDRPSSDASSNLVAATILVNRMDYSGVFVVMHKNISDDTISCHIGTRVRKNHTSRRNAFESINLPPIVVVKNRQIELQKISSTIKLQKRIIPNQSTKEKPILKFRSKFDDRVFLLKYHPGFDPKIIEYICRADYKIIIIEGTGLGHINKNCISHLKDAIKSGILVFMTSQCIWGRTNLNVYDTGRDLLNIGVIPLSNMLTETAMVKAMWLLANYDNVDQIKKMMRKNKSNEITSIINI